MRVWKFKKRKYKYINGTKGVISIFLALIMAPFTLLAGSLINAARINSAVAIFDEALCNASDSTLGTYDEFLRQRFGLLAMSQNVIGTTLNKYTVSEMISDTFDFYLQENLKTLDNTYVTTESMSEGVYSLSDTDVLLSQILEYSKYSVPTKIIEEGFSIEDIIKSIEKNIPGTGIFELITAGAGMADSFISLSEGFESLKDAINEEEIAITNYNSCYDEFEKSISKYINMKQEKENTLAQIQENIDTKQSVIDGIDIEIADTQNEIDDAKEKNNESKVKELTKTLEEKNIKRTEIETEISGLKSDYANKEKYYNGQLSTLKIQVEACVENYSSSIGVLAEKMLSVKNELVAVQNNITNVGSSTVNALVTTATTAKENVIKENSDKLNDLKEDAQKAEGEDKQKIEDQITAIQDENKNLGNQNKVTQAQKKGFDSAMQGLRTITEFETAIYVTAYNSLMNLKEKVDTYDTQNIEDDINKEEYYVVLEGRLTKEEVARVEDELLNECVKSSIWAVLKAVLGFFEALFSMTVYYNPKLGAVIDTNYYSTTYGGLPSQKDRSIYKLSGDNAEDAALSEYYKSIFGDYSSADASLLGNFDVVSAIKAIFTDLGVVMSNVASIASLKVFFDFANIYKAITDAVSRIVNNIQGIATYLANAFSESAIGNKILLSGYVAYMTSDRTTFNGSALTGKSFNMRQQKSTVEGENPISALASFISTISAVASGGTEKCFVGAEKEYIMWGNGSEIVNQVGAFSVMYIIRVVINLIPIFTNPEVASLAGASTIAAPIVYLAIILLEPFIDTIILANGGSVPIIKRTVFLTPSGIDDLFEKFTAFKLDSSKVLKIQSEFATVAGSQEYGDIIAAFGPAENQKSFFDVTYSQMLLIVMTIVTPRDKMLERLSNVIQMEAVEYKKNVQPTSNGLFDLDYSYTFIRTEASFTTNEFISISDDVGLDSQKRVIYRGY